MIYQPRRSYNIATILFGAFIRVATLVAGDFIAGDLKPPAYYAGVGIGEGVVATGLPGVAMTIYVVAETVDVSFLRSINAPQLRIFVNGVQDAIQDAYSAADIWDTLTISGLDPDKITRIDIENYAASTDPGASGIAWMALGPVTASAPISGKEVLVLDKESFLMAIAEFTVILEDAKGDTSSHNVKADRASGWTLAQAQSWIDAYLADLDDALGSKINEVTVKLPLTLVGGLKATAVAGSLNGVGASVQFRTSEDLKQSVRFPGILQTLINADKTVNVGAGSAIENLLTEYTTGTDIDTETVRPVNLHGATFDSVLGGKRIYNNND